MPDPTTADYLNALIDAKSDLVTFLNNKGVPAAADETFTSLVPKVNNIPSDAYKYPEDWPDIRFNTTDGIVLLVADIHPTVHFFLRGNNSNSRASIDWGDGSAVEEVQLNNTIVRKRQSISNAYYATHTYATQGTESSYNTYVIKINKISTGTNNIIRFGAWAGADEEVDQSWLALKFNLDTLTLMDQLATYITNTLMISTNYYLEYVDFSGATGITSLINALAYCKGLKKVIFPNSMPNLTSLNYAFYYCPLLQEIDFPAADILATMTYCCYFCGQLKKATFKGSSYPKLYNMQYAFGYTGLKNIVLPSSVGGNAAYAINLSYLFYCSQALTEVTLPTNAWYSNTTSIAGLFGGTSVKENDMSTLSMPEVTNIQNMNSATMEIIKLPKAPKVTTNGNTQIVASGWAFLRELVFPSEFASTSHVQQTWDLTNCRNLRIINGNCGVNLQRVICKGYANTPRTAIDRGQLRSVILPASSSNFGGTAPQIDFMDQSLDRAALVSIFNQLPTLSNKTITITNCIGVADLTSADIAIATAKGWTVTT